MSSARKLRRAALAASTAAMLTLVTAACEQGEVVAPEHDLAAARGNSPVVEQTADLLPLHGIMDADIDGMARLTRAADGLSVRVKASGADVEPGDAFTFWAVAFNNPDACRSDPCSLADLFTRTRSVGGTLLNFGGGYDMDDDGMLEMDEGGGQLARLSTEGVQLLFPADAPPGLQKGIKNPYRAEVHVILRNHGMKESDPADRADQTSMVGAFCNLLDEGRDDTDPVQDGCADQGVAIFLSAEAPGADRSG